VLLSHFYFLSLSIYSFSLFFCFFYFFIVAYLTVKGRQQPGHKREYAHPNFQNTRVEQQQQRKRLSDVSPLVVFYFDHLRRR